jgi:hypothetical protein
MYRQRYRLMYRQAILLAIDPAQKTTSRANAGPRLSQPEDIWCGRGLFIFFRSGCLRMFAGQAPGS